MATFNKFQAFVADLANKVHNLGSDSLKVALTNTIPVATNAQLSDLTEITYTNLSSRVLTTTSSAQTAGTYKLILADLTMTSSGGTTGPFQYVVIYNDTSTGKRLIGWYDRGVATTLQDGDSVVLDLDNVNGLLQLA